jgi:hypothetical protein
MERIYTLAFHGDLSALPHTTGRDQSRLIHCSDMEAVIALI